MSPPKIPKIQRQKKKNLPDPENWMTSPQKKPPKTQPKRNQTKAQRKLNLG
jgi:hypothetical protein